MDQHFSDYRIGSFEEYWFVECRKCEDTIYAMARSSNVDSVVSAIKRHEAAEHSE